MATVYKILSPDLTECYVGSTTTTMEVRRRSHLSKCNKTASRILFERYGEESCKFIVLEVCPLEERRIKEQWWLEHSVGTVNTNNAFVSPEYWKDYNTKYAEDNKEAIRLRKKIWWENYKKTRSPEDIARKKAYLKEYGAKKAKSPAEPSVAQ